VPPLDDDDEDEQQDSGPARIVKTKEFTIKPMTAEEALLQMDLLGHDFFLFTSSETGRAAVIYRRNDGNFGLIEAAG
jgi:putative sigma-54 modulation protein